ncbi:MAG TPA: hypothetical protein VE619_02995 [Nitrososphaeraceae archaeon]|nr:hypothetical protein [Nitrososphaeraceae archaeon]
MKEFVIKHYQFTVNFAVNYFINVTAYSLSNIIAKKYSEQFFLICDCLLKSVSIIINPKYTDNHFMRQPIYVVFTSLKDQSGTELIITRPSP